MTRTLSIGVTFAIMLLAGAAAQAARTGTMGVAEGDPAAVTCPNKTYLAGFALQYDTSMSGLMPYCVAMAPDGAWAGGAQIHLETMTGPANSGGSRLDIFCPLDFYTFGFKGYTHVYGIHAVMQLTVTCKNVKTGALTGLATRYPDGVSVTEWRGAQCTDDSVADGVFGFIHAAEIIQFGLSCAQTRPASLYSNLKNTQVTASQSLISQVTFPSVLAPTAGQRFYAQSSVAIKLAPPKSWTVTSYLVAVQRKDPSGNWIVQTNLPIAAAQAQSAAGYTEFGTGGSGPTKYPQSLTSPGAWRLNAQVSSPKQSGWSDWVEFAVVNSPFSSPSKATSSIPGILKK